MDSRKARHIVSAAILLGFGAFNFLTHANTTTLQSTLVPQPGLAQHIPTIRISGDSISGQFHETNGILVIFYILNSAQFASRQVGGAFNCIYSIKDVASRSFCYAVSTQDIYYLTYLTHDLFRLQLAFIFVAVAGIDLLFAFQVRTSKTPALPPPVPTVAPPNP